MHGTVERYQDGCTCSACILAIARLDEAARVAAVLDALDRGRATRSQRGLCRQRRAVSSHTLATGELAVDCWCRAAIVYVAPEVVRACRTGSCGLPGCDESAVAA